VFLSWEFKSTTKHITKQIVSKKVWKQLDQKPTQKYLALVLFLVFGLWPSHPPRGTPIFSGGPLVGIGNTGQPVV
jgi:hypothetical protein